MDHQWLGRHSFDSKMHLAMQEARHRYVHVINIEKKRYGWKWTWNIKI